MVPGLAADPADHGTLVAVSPPMVATYHVSGDTPQSAPLAENDAFTGCGGFAGSPDVAVAAGGAQFAVACPSATTVLSFASATLAPIAAADYAVNAPDAVAIAPHNSGVAAGNIDLTAPELATFKLHGTPVHTYPLSAGEWVANNGLSWSADGTRLYAVLHSGANYYLDVLRHPQH